MSPLRAAVAAEWTKLRTLPATAATLVPFVVISVGLGYLVALAFRLSFDQLPPDQRSRFDPLFATFYSLTLGQLALVVFGVLVVGSEYGSGTIRSSLLAVPRRGRFYAAKLIAAALPMSGVAVITVLGTFFAAQVGLGPRHTSLGAPGVAVAVLGGCLYLVLIGLFAVGVTTALRSSTWALVILMPLLFLGSQGLGNVPKINTVTRFLPDQAGQVILHLAGPPDDPRFGRPYGPWTGLAILALWTVTALSAGYAALHRRDA